MFPKVKVIGEPQLGKKGLYPQISIVRDKHPAASRMDFLTYADGDTSIFDIANITNIPLQDILTEYKTLKDAGVLDIS